MLPRLCTDCSKCFFCKISFNRHNKTFHRPHVQPAVDDDLRLRSANGAGTSQSNFENADNKVDVTSQTDFDDDNLSTVANDGSDSDDSSQHSDFSLNSQQSSDEEYGDTLSDIYSFWHLEMVDQMKKWSVNKLKQVVPSVFYNLTLISRALSRDDILKSIMDTAEHFQEMFLSGC